MNRTPGCFVTATDTDAGKTLVMAALCEGFAEQGRALRAIKPVQTGCVPRAEVLPANPEAASPEAWIAPDVAIWRAAAQRGRAKAGDLGTPAATTGEAGDASQYGALECFGPACSPHLAARLAGRRLDPEDLVRRIVGDRERQGQALPGQPDLPVLIEGAGGLFTPLTEPGPGQTEGTHLLDLIVALDLPVLLVVPNRLGCLNQALLSLEALERRGLHLAGLVLNRPDPDPAPADPDQSIKVAILADNAALLARRIAPAPLLELPHIRQHGSAATAAPELPAYLRMALCKLVAAHAFELPAEQGAPVSIPALSPLLEQDRRHLWHPYTSALNPLPVREVVGAEGTRLRLADGRELVDGMASWWCAVHGYRHPELRRALRTQADRFAHVMFGGLTHAPAVHLAERLLPLLPGELTRLFYADSGSVAVEVALKMAIQYWRGLGRRGKTRFVTPRGGYHGDTFGAMSVCDPVTGMHTLFSGLLAEQIFVPRPPVPFGAAFDPACLEPVEAALARHGQEVAACILEPVVQGAGGMWIYHPEYLRGLRALCDRYEVLLILDEIATGFGRTGRFFAAAWAGIAPDILCLGKALTGGTLSLAITAATERVARGLSAEGGVLMHGPTFMGNPLACAVALASLDLLLASPWEARVAGLEQGLRRGLAPCAHVPGVRDVRVLGGIGVVETDQPVDVARLQDFFVEQGVWIRPFNRTIYLMPPYITSAPELDRLTGAVVRAVEQGRHRP